MSGSNPEEVKARLREVSDFTIARDALAMIEAQEEEIARLTKLLGTNALIQNVEIDRLRAELRRLRPPPPGPPDPPSPAGKPRMVA